MILLKLKLYTQNTVQLTKLEYYIRYQLKKLLYKNQYTLKGYPLYKQIKTKYSLTKSPFIFNRSKEQFILNTFIKLFKIRLKTLKYNNINIQLTIFFYLQFLYKKIKTLNLKIKKKKKYYLK